MDGTVRTLRFYAAVFVSVLAATFSASYLSFHAVGRAHGWEQRVATIARENSVWAEEREKVVASIADLRAEVSRVQTEITDVMTLQAEQRERVGTLEGRVATSLDEKRGWRGGTTKQLVEIREALQRCRLALPKRP